jgi:hypothetical protein
VHRALPSRAKVATSRAGEMTQTSKLSPSSQTKISPARVTMTLSTKRSGVPSLACARSSSTSSFAACASWAHIRTPPFVVKQAVPLSYQMPSPPLVRKGYDLELAHDALRAHAREALEGRDAA